MSRTCTGCKDLVARLGLCEVEKLAADSAANKVKWSKWEKRKLTMKDVEKDKWPYCHHRYECEHEHDHRRGGDGGLSGGAGRGGQGGVCVGR
jgi:hypothetical protein